VKFLILVDTHEPKTISEKLKQLGIPITRKKLLVGDYTWNDICIERKTVQDFYSSIYSREPENNLFSQLFQLKQYKIPILIIQGNLFTKYKLVGRKRVIIQNKEFNRRIKTAFTILAKLPISYGIYHYLVQDQVQLVKIIHSLYLNTLNREAYAPVKRKGKTLEEIKENVFTCFPGIGRKRARALASKYSIRQIAVSSIDSLNFKNISQIIGETRARKLIECLNL